jgi:site-specific DNA-cytosine methylase
MTTEWTLIDLFAGLGGFSAAFTDTPQWSVTTVDIDESFDPDITADVCDLGCDDLPDPDVVLASPPCKCFSVAAGWMDHFDSDGNPQTAAARESVVLLHHTLGLIKALAPRYWYLENPRGSKATQYLGQPTGSVTYCQYGTSYQKPTYLWGKHPPMSYLSCDSAADCHNHGTREDDYVYHPMPRDPKERAKVPLELSEAIREAVESALLNTPPQQVTLGHHD